MPKIAIVVHGGAGPDSEYIQQHQDEYKKGISEAVDAGYAVLESGGSAVAAVEAAVRTLEDNPFFNAGKGSAINASASIEMCSSIMDGQNIECGAVAIVKDVKNPVSLARQVMEKSRHIYLGNSGAMQFAKEVEAPTEPEAYFITDHAYEQFESKREELEKEGKLSNELMHGTVGAVALDKEGNVAAATSTGGTECNYPGRIGDSSMAGVGTYANNETCAVSTTGDGEYNIRFVTAFHISALMEYKNMAVQEACDYLIHEKAKEAEGDMGVIAVDAQGEIGIAFSADRMHRGWRTDESEGMVEIY